VIWTQYKYIAKRVLGYRTVLQNFGKGKLLTRAKMDKIGGGFGGGLFAATGVFVFLNRQWTLMLKNNSNVSLIPAGTSESSGSLNSPLKEIKPGRTEMFIWKKTFMAEAGAVGAIHFKIGDTGKLLTVFGCIPMNMVFFKPGCNIHVGPYKPSADDLEDGKNGCRDMLEAGQVGNQYGCTYTISNKAEADFTVEFSY